MTFYDVTPQMTQEKPLDALRLLVYENPKALAAELSKIGFTAVPDQGESLFQYIYDYLYHKNGNRATIISAFSRVPIVTPPPAGVRNTYTKTSKF